VRYGGWGYGHVLTHMAPLLAERGVDASTIEAITTRTPARILTLTPG
jgi:predicted metal-dependent phosphotriesterase family hydrolase